MQGGNREILTEFNTYLATTVACSVPSLSELKGAIGYALLNGGKRIRPLFFLSVLHSFKLDYKRYFPAAAALEYIHCYSLVHDDLPAMDNDDLRRGKATVHKKYDEATAILVGDALLTQAFKLIADSVFMDAEKRIQLMALLSASAGAEGMIGGQFLDMQETSANRELSHLKQIHRLKTGKLLSAAIEMALLIVEPPQETAQNWITFGELFGEFFQIRDDLMDKNATQEDLGKKPGSDAEKQKLTYPNLIGDNESEKTFETCYRKINHCLNNMDGNVSFFSEMTKTLYTSYQKAAPAKNN